MRCAAMGGECGRYHLGERGLACCVLHSARWTSHVVRGIAACCTARLEILDDLGERRLREEQIRDVRDRERVLEVVVRVVAVPDVKASLKPG